MVINKMFSQDEYNNLFTYKNGVLYWKTKTANCVKIGTKAGYTNKEGYTRLHVGYKYFFRHRVIYTMFNGTIPYGCYIDHIDGNPGNDKIENLRLATHGQNNYNAKKHNRNTSGFKGVCFDKNTGLWIAQIMINKKTMYLGRFKTPEIASKRYKVAARLFHKQFFNKSV